VSEPLDTFDEELRREEYDPYRGVHVIGRLCINEPQFFADVFPLALAALVEKRLAVIAPKPRAKSERRASK
jgi:hypothetical protein